MKSSDDVGLLHLSAPLHDGVIRRKALVIRRPYTT